MKAISVVLTLFVLNFVIPRARSISVESGETLESKDWLAAKLEGKPAAPLAKGYLIGQLKSGALEKNGIQGEVGGIRGLYPLRIGDNEYKRGLHCPSSGAVLVHLPVAAQTFEAVVGIDSNDMSFISNAGRGGVIVSVAVGPKELFRSSVMHEGSPGVAVKVDLGGATDFTIRIENVADDGVFGKSWDHTDWSDAHVTLADGKTLWLDELPIGPLPASYTSDAPFSFRYGGQASTAILKTWQFNRTIRALDAQRTQYTLSYTDPKTGLLLRWVAVAYRDFPTVEWTLYFKNTGIADTPILEDIQAVDTGFERNGDGEFLLHYNRGSSAKITDFEPLQTTLNPKSETRISPVGGRPSNGQFPYFDLAWPGQGLIVAVGWPGQWAAHFTRDPDTGIHIRAGQELTHFKLHPGEEVRTPLIALQFYKGDWIRGQDIWRQWMVVHNLPRPGGSLPPPQWAANSTKAYIEMQEANEENQKLFVDRYLQEGLKLDYWWMDAGWYPFKGSWVNTGTWEPDPKRFPNGLRAVSDYAHSKNTKIVVWFEPERVTPGTWLYEKHPEWLLQPPPNPGDQAYQQDYRLLNYGDPQALQWITDHVDELIKTQGIDLYRQDFNMDPLYFWRAQDAKDREGITEIRYVEGLLAYWDELHRRHPTMILDTCASGGRRVDLETLRRNVPLTRSDYVQEAVGQQGHTYGIAMWIPYYGSEVNGMDAYALRSQMVPAMMTRWDLRRKDLPYAVLRQQFEQWRQIADIYYGDYYPLTPYSTLDDQWMAWQFDRPDLRRGMVQAFRRTESSFQSATFTLRGLDSNALYMVTNLDTPESGVKMTGQQLMHGGLTVLIKNEPGAAIVVYDRLKQ
jgi:alpha-galactosidase